RDVMVEALIEDGHQVRSASDGVAGLEIAEEWAPDLVVLDLMLPGLSGEQFCFAMRQVPGLSEVPIVVVSAARSALEMSARCGAAATLRKPFDLLELVSQVEELLRGRLCPQA